MSDAGLLALGEYADDRWLANSERDRYYGFKSSETAYVTV